MAAFHYGTFHLPRRGRITCHACDAQIVLPAQNGSWVVLIYLDSDGLIYDAHTLGKIHQCRFRRAWFCPTCYRYRSPARRARSIRSRYDSPICPVCHGHMKLVVLDFS